MKSYGVTIQMKVTEQYFSLVLFIMLHIMVLTFEFGDEMSDHSNETFLLQRPDRDQLFSSLVQGN